ncbi:MAG: glutamate-5-semialdehyde dehydrogenase [Gemmataceae bacterium]|nr:glutamate-5-semialdehyde dehydrogenase [Gemmataceae bacterium]MDW8243807.1 glutamate-5-semialdehyde dehydrogenase [Thermogemmata sp.]
MEREAAALENVCRGIALRARQAAQELALMPAERKNRWLLAVAEALEREQASLLEANAQDVATAPAKGLTAAAIDRLKLTPARLRAAAEGLRQVAALPDPVGEIRGGERRPNGLEVLKVGVPLGVIFFIYESRPNVTIDAAGLCVKSGNAVILRGGSEAFHSNTALTRLLRAELIQAGLPEDAVQSVPTPERAAVGWFLRWSDCVDLVIPRGGKSLIERVVAEARMPVLKHYDGNCHVYVDAAADLEMAERIVVNAKCQRPGVCNAAESLLVHAAVADAFLPRIGLLLQQRGVELRGCAETRRRLPQIRPATEEDYRTEYLDLILAVKVVDSLEQAIVHINTYGSRHTDAIITRDLAAARLFVQRVDAAAVMVNASTRFHDGFEMGLGAEIGISTDKFHARGPCGLRELTTYKYVVIGQGHVRE